jgi:hypothetical protein
MRAGLGRWAALGRGEETSEGVRAARMPRRAALERGGGRARERAFGRDLLGVPLFDRDFLPKFE